MSVKQKKLMGNDMGLASIDLSLWGGGRGLRMTREEDRGDDTIFFCVHEKKKV